MARHELCTDLTTAAGQRQDAPDRRFATHASKNEHPMPRWFRSRSTRSPSPSKPGDGRFTPPFPLWWALEPSFSGVFFPKERSDEPPHGHPVAPRPAPRAFTRETQRPRAKIASALPHVNGTRPTSTQMPSACKGPSPGRPPGNSFAAAPRDLMLFAKPAFLPASLGPCPCRPLSAKPHPRGPRTTCQRLQPNTTHEHTRDLPNLAHGRGSVRFPSRGSLPSLRRYRSEITALSDNDPCVDCQRARVSSPKPLRAPHRLAEPTLGRGACE